jgi:hypothetical protein
MLLILQSHPLSLALSIMAALCGSDTRIWAIFVDSELKWTDKGKKQPKLMRQFAGLSKAKAEARGPLSRSNLHAFCLTPPLVPESVLNHARLRIKPCRVYLPRRS